MITENCKGQKPHVFEPRYNEEPIPFAMGNSACSWTKIHLKRTYIYDICIRCGITVKEAGDVE